MSVTPHRLRRVFYIAGPMSGIEDYNFPAFFLAEKNIERLGHRCVNPAHMDIVRGFDPKKDTPTLAFIHDAFRRDFSAIANECTDIALLPGWQDSSGATAEREVARLCGLGIHELTAALELPAECVS